MAGFGEGLSGARAMRVVPSVPPGRTSVVPDIDLPDHQSTRRSAASGMGLFIEYVDAKGCASARRIACRNVDPVQGLLTAWCFEREALRQFRIDRIESAACTETGEVFELAELMATMASRGLPANDPRLARILVVLTFLMRCDGVHARELECIEQAVTSFALRFDGDDALVEQGLRLGNTLAPDGRDFLRTLGWLIRRPDAPELAVFLRRHAAAVIDADGSHSAGELRFGMELDDLLTRIGKRQSA